jgi:hypothetical protein
MIVVVRDESISTNKGVRIQVDGPTPSKHYIGMSEWDVIIARCKPGSYSVHPLGGANLDSSEIVSELILPEETVRLAPFRLRVTMNDDGGIRIVSEMNDEEDRQRAGRVLASFVTFPNWASSQLEGFGGIRPALNSSELLYKVVIGSQPENAEIYMDGLLIGRSPLAVYLSPGKKQLQFRLSGRDDVIRYIEPESDEILEVELPSAREDSRDAGNVFILKTAPFYSMGNPDPQLSTLFSESIMFVLEDDLRLEVSTSDIPWVSRGAVMLPDFSNHEASGIDLVASGIFLRDGKELTIQANLYDVRNETIKAGIRWSGPVGLDLFEAVDEISEAFVTEVDKVLPEAGKTLITRQETVYTGTGTDEMLLSRKKVVQARRSWNHLLSLSIGTLGLDEGLVLDDGISTAELYSRFYNPPLILGIEWDWLSAEYLGVMAGFAVITGVKDPLYHPNERTTDYSLYGAARLNLGGYRSDLFYGLGIGMTYSPSGTYTADYPVQTTDEIGPFLNLALRMDLGLRQFVHKRAEARPVFWNLKIHMSLYEYRFDLTGGGNQGRVPMNFGISIGTGVGL